MGTIYTWLRTREEYWLFEMKRGFNLSNIIEQFFVSIFWQQLTGE